jgi:glycosyltransferase involved in cell wall biosynthesis
VHLGIDHARFAPEPQDDDEATARRHALPERFVFYPANLWQHKNHERLIDAFAQVGDDALELLLAGETYGRLEPLLERARRAGVGRRVRHLGHVPPAEVPALLRRATALVFPSLYEGFGAPPLEAMACGCPVASSTRASLAEVCGDAALAFDPEDPGEIAAAIERVATDGELRVDLRDHGLEHAGRFSWEAAARGHVAAYEQALGA